MMSFSSSSDTVDWNREKEKMALLDKSLWWSYRTFFCAVIGQNASYQVKWTVPGGLHRGRFPLSEQKIEMLYFENVNTWWLFTTFNPLLLPVKTKQVWTNPLHANLCSNLFSLTNAFLAFSQLAMSYTSTWFPLDVQYCFDHLLRSTSKC